MNDDYIDYKILGLTLIRTIPATILGILVFEAVVFFFNIFGHNLFTERDAKLYPYIFFMINFGILTYREYYKLLKQKEREKEREREK